MKKLYYYLDDSDSSIGPLTAAQLREAGIERDTLVWCDGMADWTEASLVPALAELFAQSDPQPLCPPPLPDNDETPEPEPEADNANPVTTSTSEAINTESQSEPSATRKREIDRKRAQNSLRELGIISLCLCMAFCIFAAIGSSESVNYDRIHVFDRISTVTDKLEAQGFKLVDIAKGVERYNDNIRNIYIFEKEDSDEKILLAVYHNDWRGWEYEGIRKWDHVEEINGNIVNSDINNASYINFYTEQ